MPIEAELKARVRDVPALLAALDEQAEAEKAVYRDRYFDSPDGSFASSGRELRIRTVETDAGVRHILTFKQPAVDAASGSKPEYETVVGDADTAEAIVLGLGYRTMIAFSKHCANYRWNEQDRDLLATVVTVPEIDGTFIELETITETENELVTALEVVRAALGRLGVSAGDLTTELYTDAVAAVLPGWTATSRSRPGPGRRWLPARSRSVGPKPCRGLGRHCGRRSPERGVARPRRWSSSRG